MKFNSKTIFLIKKYGVQYFSREFRFEFMKKFIDIIVQVVTARQLEIEEIKMIIINCN